MIFFSISSDLPQVPSFPSQNFLSNNLCNPNEVKGEDVRRVGVHGIMYRNRLVNEDSKMRGSRTCRASKEKDRKRVRPIRKKAIDEASAQRWQPSRETRGGQQLLGPGKAILENYSAWLVTLVGSKAPVQGELVSKQTDVCRGRESDTGGLPARSCLNLRSTFLKSDLL